MKTGDRVKWLNPMNDAEATERFTVIEVNGDRCFIEAVCDLNIKPQSVAMVAELVADEDCSREVQIDLGGEVRNVTIKRFSPAHCWYANTPILCRFRTGNKTHRVGHPQVCERNGEWFFPTQVVHNRHVAPVRFDAAVGSLETSRW